MNTQNRSAARRDFVRAHLPIEEPIIASASTDASFRSYWRVCAGARTRIVMDAPPERESIAAWLEIGARLRHVGLHTPQVFATDIEQGFVLMEDMGNCAFLSALNLASADALYTDAIQALTRMQRIDTAGLPAYDRAKLIAEMELLPEWFFKRHLGFIPSCDEWDVIEAAFTHLVHAAQEQPQCFVHRDYHSRNLMVCQIAGRDSGLETRDSGKKNAASILANPGIIDFQDAVCGPLTYDLASLLRDCYIAWPAERVHAWAETFRRNVAAKVDATTFMRWFDLTGLQRHIKVLGIFCRLNYRDGKPGYLTDLPRVLDYTLNISRRYPELCEFAALLQRAVGERDLRVPSPESRVPAVAPCAR